MMDAFSDKLSLIRGVCESWDDWNEHQRKSSCRALIWLCDQLQEDVKQRCPDEREDYVSGYLESIREAAEKGSRSGKLDVREIQQHAGVISGLIPDRSAS
jgi:hypothetical protein